jgi:serine/threonine-protein kinase HipA
VHQEDTCQSLSIHPANKYQNEGGPGVREIVSLLRDHSSNAEADQQTFLDAVILNWLIGGTDAHAKNFSVLLGGGGQVRLAPLYDMVSRLPYDPWHPFELRLAMRIGDEYKLGRIGPRHWERLAREIEIPARELWQRVLAVASRTPEALEETKQQLGNEGIEDAVLNRLVERATARALGEAKVFRKALRGGY